MYISPLEHLATLLTHEPCVICGTGVHPLCRPCFSMLSEDQDSRCYICNKLTKQNRVCPSCTSRLRRVWWAGLYAPPLKDMIAAIKLGRNRTVARRLGGLLPDLLPHIDRATVIVPIPTAASRIRRRGFDQAVIMARHLAHERDLTYAPLLVRTSNVDQIGKRRSERIQQMKNSFVVSPQYDQFKSRPVLLVDDVLTTGATLESAAAAMRSVGVSHVDGVVVARHVLK